MNTSKIIYEQWGETPYTTAWEKQESYFQEALEAKYQQKKTINRLILCQHPHVITLGKHANKHNLLFPTTYLQEKNVELVQTNRGGDITYHGPGQIVGYPILDLEQFGIGLKEYIYKLEQVIIRFVAQYGIKSDRLDGATGVWIDGDLPTARKICAIGVRSSRYVTMHGFALNINTDLDFFSLIHPCGFVDKGVTSMQKELQHSLSMEKCQEELKTLFMEEFC